MNKIIFTKLTGAGNDFILVDRKKNPELKMTEKIIRAACDRRYGIGADGLIEIIDSENSNFRMVYYNSNGREGSLCGNGSRCAIKYADYSNRLVDGKAVFLCGSEEFSGRMINENEVEFHLNNPLEIRTNYNIPLLGKELRISFADTGSPHAVIDIEEIKNEFLDERFENIFEFPVDKFGRAVRHSESFAPAGANVNFYSIEENHIIIRTFERGVEAETFACGTGSVATAIIAFINRKVLPPVTLITKGKDKLKVDFNFEKDKISNVTLTGPAEIVFNGEFYLFNLRGA